MDSSSPDITSKGANHRLRKLLGRAYLRENRVSEALEVYFGILKDFPNDPDVLLVLGNLYRLSGNPAAAECLVRRVVALNPGEPLAEKQASKFPEDASAEWDFQELLSPLAVQKLIERLQTSNTPARLDQIRTAADMLDRTTAEEHILEPNGQGPEDVQQLLPALIELNIRQARAAGYPDLAEALQSLQINLTRQVDDRWADDLLRDDNLLESSSPNETD